MLKAHHKMLRRLLRGCSCMSSTLRCVCGQSVTGLTGRNTRCPECSHIPSAAQHYPVSNADTRFCYTHPLGINAPTSPLLHNIIQFQMRTCVSVIHMRQVSLLPHPLYCNMPPFQVKIRPCVICMRQALLSPCRL